MKVWAGCLLVVGVLWGANGADGQTTPAPTEQGIRAQLTATSFLILRGMYAGDHLAFDAQGNLVGDASTLPFSLSAFLPESVRLTDTQLEIEGSRAALEMEPGPTAQAAETVEAVQWRKHKRDKLAITIARDPQNPELLEAALKKVLSTGLDDGLLATVPEFWQPWLRHQLHPDPAQESNPGTIPLTHDGKVLPGMKPPWVIRSVDPKFSQQARQRQFAGICVVDLVVDAAGNPRELRIVRALGMGLDEAAVDAVGQYKFGPATQNGRPVPVEVNVQVNFKIY